MNNTNKNNNLISSSVKLVKPKVGIGPNHKSLKEYKLSLKELSNVQWEASIGLMLGDACLQTQNKGRNYRLKFEWGNINKLYTEHVYNLFDEWVLSPPHKKTRTNNKGNTVINWGFQTISHEAFNSLKDLFLINKHKGVVNNLIKNHLTERGLAYWFMDDGGKLDYNKNSINKSIVLNTHSFTLNEVEMMSKELSDKFNLDTEVRLNKSKYVIVIKSDSYPVFNDLTQLHIIPSMRYKLPGI